MNSELELLRRYEPIVRYTQGEMFFPCPVEPYIERCSLWRRVPDGPPEQLVPAGELTREKLVAYALECEAPLFLRFVQAPLSGIEYERWRKSRPPFQGSGRLARVGLLPRFIDSMFQLSLYLRGKVPGGTTGRAELQYRDIRQENPAVPYYGRVVRSDGYIVLQYHFFYAMNDWRSSFYGVNDHEADLEQVLIYLDDEEGREPRPIWFACAAHDYSGDDLRRRWDDPELTIIDGHPVVYAGAGSHAAYFRPGEYLTSVEIKFLRPVAKAIHAGRRVWRDVLGQGDPTAAVRAAEALVRVPFVDYARGDGVSVGPGQVLEWSPVVIGDDTDWVHAYRGLWGLDTEDVFAGELAPAGPKYTREGTVRHTWYDPIGWAGLGKVAPPSRTPAAIEERLRELAAELEKTQSTARSLTAELRGLDAQMIALSSDGSVRQPVGELRSEIARREAELNTLRARESELERSIIEMKRSLEAVDNGDLGSPRAHIHRSMEPEPPGAARRSRLAELWAALSVGLLLLTGAALVTFTDTDTLASIGVLIAAAVFVDSILRGTLRTLLLNTTVVLAVITGAILIYEFAWQLALAGVAVIGVIILAQNLRKLRGR